MIALAIALETVTDHPVTVIVIDFDLLFQFVFALDVDDEFQ